MPQIIEKAIMKTALGCDEMINEIRFNLMCVVIDGQRFNHDEKWIKVHFHLSTFQQMTLFF